MASNLVKRLAKYITEQTYYDKDSNTLFATNPGISYETLKGLAKKRGFTVAQVKEGDVVSVPAKYKYMPFDQETAALYDNFVSTYTHYNKSYAELQTAYTTFNQMDENLSEVSLILDTYVAEVLSQGFVQNPLKIDISNDKAQKLIEAVFYKNKIYERLPAITRALAKYGNFGIALCYPYLEEWLHLPEEEKKKVIDFNRLDIVEDLNLLFVNPMHFKVNVDDYMNVINYETQLPHNQASDLSNSVLNNRTWQPWQFTHLKIYSEITEPYGKSMLWSMRSSFDQLTTLEALLGISRASKIQRLVFTVPLPNGVSFVDAYGYLNEFRSNYINSIFSDYSSAKAGRKMPGAMSILTLPESHDGKKVSVDKIEANIDLSQTEDVEYFLDKILRNSSLPKGYLVGEDVITTAQTLEAQDLKLKRTLIPLRQGVLNGMMNLIENILTHAGYDVSKLTIKVGLNEPIQVPADVIEKYADISELLKSFMELNPAMTDINKFQFLIQMGMPSTLAQLVLSKVSVSVLDTPDDLAKYLKNQKLKQRGVAPIGGDDSQDNPQFGESVNYWLTNKEYLAANYSHKKQLKEFADAFRTSTDFELKESLLVPGKKVLTESKEDAE